MDRDGGSGAPGGVSRRQRLAGRLRLEPRPLPGVRALRTSLRTLHILAFAALFGGHVHGVEPARLLPSLAATLATGGALAALDAWRSPVWWVQVRGVATLVKLGLVIGAGIFPASRVALLAAVVAIGAVTSHMPGRFRYFSLLHGRSVGHEEKG